MFPGFQLKLVWATGVGSPSWYMALKPKFALWSLELVAGLEEITVAGWMEPPPVTLPSPATEVTATPLENSEVSLTAVPVGAVIGRAVTVAVAKISLVVGTAVLKVNVKPASPDA